MIRVWLGYEYGMIKLWLVYDKGMISAWIWYDKGVVQPFLIYWPAAAVAAVAFPDRQMTPADA